MSSNGCSSMTPNDKEVLKQIFSDGLVNDDELEATNNQDQDQEHQNEVVDNENDLQAKALELQAIQEAEKGDFTTALVLCSQAIELTPNRASSYNNRAQVSRLKGDIEGALSDLSKAIDLSQSKGPVACQAFTQRGLIRIRNDEKELAREDLQKASDLGSGFAKQVLAAMNPYAALCNQMLGEVMQKLQTGEA